MANNAKLLATAAVLLVALSSLALACQTDAECSSGYVCVYGACAQTCTTDAQCQPDRCVDGHCADIPNSCAVSNEWAGTGGGTSWISLAFLGILVVMLFLSILYMCGVLFKRLRWIIWAKDEFYQAIISAIIILVVAWIALASCEASFALAGGDPFKIADIYLNNLIWEKTLRIATGVFLTGIYGAITAAYQIPMLPPPSGFRPMAGLSAVGGVMNFLFLITSTLFSSLVIQMLMLKIIQAFMFKVILPLGVFFRVFPFLRKAGATFIAMALGFYLVFPMLYVMDKAIMESILSKQITFENDPSMSFGESADTYAFSPVFRMIAVTDHIQSVANLIPQALFLPTFNIVITYAFIKSMAKIFAQNFPSPFEEPQVGRPSIPTTEMSGGV